MDRRGSKPQGKVKIRWSPEFAYAIGLLVTDGNLSPDGRHINFTSKDKSLIQSFKSILRLQNKIGRKARGKDDVKKYYVIQFGDVLFYKFLIEIGITPRKSKTLASIKIPRQYFFDFLRGHFDGDGTFYSYWDPRWRSSFMFYTEFISASKKHIDWLRRMLSGLLKIKGHVTHDGKRATYQLKYAKRESLILLKHIYYATALVCLDRKCFKINRALSILGKHL